MSLLQFVGRPDSAHTEARRFEEQSEPARGVLIVDDDEMIRTFLGLFFRQQRLHFWLAKSGAEAVEIFHEHHQEIALVLLDVRMPELDGPHTFLRLQQIDPGLSCYFMSGHWEPYTEKGLLGMGSMGLIVKPFLVKTLSDIVHHSLANA